MTTIITINGTDSISSSRSDINTNFSSLNADKVETLSDLLITASSDELNYCDGVTSAIQTQIDSKMASITGEIKLVAFGEGSIPSGYLICDGAAVNRTTYADLFTAIGTTFGVGNGTTTFNVPDLRGRVPGGKDDMGQGSANTITDTNADTLGGEYGTETHTLTESEMPSHTHALNLANGTGSGTFAQADTTGSPAVEASGVHATATGGDSAHMNVQPTLFLNFIIKT